MEKHHDFLQWILDGREKKQWTMPNGERKQNDDDAASEIKGQKVRARGQRAGGRGAEWRSHKPGAQWQDAPGHRLAWRMLRLPHEFLDLDERLIDLFAVADLVYSPIADIKEFPENVDVAWSRARWPTSTTSSWRRRSVPAARSSSALATAP